MGTPREKVGERGEGRGRFSQGETSLELRKMEGLLSILCGSRRPKRHAGNGIARGCQPPFFPLLSSPRCFSIHPLRAAPRLLPAPSAADSKEMPREQVVTAGRGGWTETDIRPPPTLGLSGSARSPQARLPADAGSRVPPAPRACCHGNRAFQPSITGAFLAWAERRLAWLEMEAGAGRAGAWLLFRARQ